MILGGFTAADNWPNLSLSAEDTWNIDTKLDDGKPTTGRVRSSGNTASPDCSTTDDETSEYLLSGTTAQACRIIFLLD